jgi:hypothetical protein
VAAHKKDINLLASMTTTKKSRVSLLAILIPVIVFLILGALLAVGSFWYVTTTTALETERSELQFYLNSSRVETSHERENAARELAETTRRQAEDLKGTLYNLSSYPDLYGEHFDAIFALAGDDIHLADYAYDRRTGIMSFSASSQSVRRMPHFIKGLRDCEYFSDIQYRGYVRSSHNESGRPIIDPITDITTVPTISIIEYRYEITCQLTRPNPALPAVETGEGTAGGGNVEGSGEPEGGGTQEGSN